MRIITLILAFCLLFVSSLSSYVKGDYALNVIYELSDKKYMGRQAGTLENRDAINFLSSELDKINISNYFLQDFPVEVYDLKDMPEFTIKYNQEIRKFKYREDFRDRFSGSWKVEAPIEVDVKNIKDNFWLTDYRNGVTKSQVVASIYSAKGVILGVPKDMTELIFEKSMFFQNSNLPVIYISSQVFQSIKDLLDKNQKVIGYYRIEYDKRLEKAYNLIFYVPSKVKNDRVLLISAHVDHVGKDPDNTFFPGANDNASGVGVLMEIAKLILEKGNNYPFNILFLITNAEEKGLLGAKYFAENSPIPLNNIFLSINLDCVGRGKFLTVGYNTYAEKYVKKLRVSANFVKDYYLSDSDQYIFHLLEIPVLFFIRSDSGGYIPDLHQKTDTREKIPRENLVETIDLFFNILDDMTLKFF